MRNIAEEVQHWVEENIKPIIQKALDLLTFYEEVNKYRGKDLGFAQKTSFGEKLYHWMKKGGDKIITANERISPRKFLELLFGVKIDLEIVKRADKWGMLEAVAIENSYFFDEVMEEEYSGGVFHSRRIGVSYLYYEFLKNIVELGKKLVKVKPSKKPIEYLDNFNNLIKDVVELNKLVEKIGNNLFKEDSLVYKILLLNGTPAFILKRKIPDYEEYLRVLGVNTEHPDFIPPLGTKREDYKIYYYTKSSYGLVLFDLIKNCITYLGYIWYALVMGTNIISGLNKPIDYPPEKAKTHPVAKYLRFTPILRGKIKGKAIICNKVPYYIDEYYKYWPEIKWSSRYKYKRNVGGYRYSIWPEYEITVHIDEKGFIKEIIARRSDNEIKYTDIKATVYDLLENVANLREKNLIYIRINKLTNGWHITIEPFW